MLQAFGVPVVGLTPRRKTKMAKAFIAVAGIKPRQSWAVIKVNDPSHRLRSRDVIRWMNDHLGESISSGSYDDIRRKDLIHAVEAGIVLRAAGNDGAATNDGTRGYAINPDFANLIRKFGTREWDAALPQFMAGKTTLVEQLKRKRLMELIPVRIGDRDVVFSPGEHNQIQKAIIDEFLPRFGHDADVLYVGDTSDKYLFLDEERLKELKFFQISHDKLPDVLAYSAEKGWLFLIEAVHSANPIDPMRKRTLELLTASCAAGIIYVTAFLNRDSFKKFVADIAWETEVWIADDPDHMIHFNGDKFLGPYIKNA
jgi:type II restriction enzyme